MEPADNPTWGPFSSPIHTQMGPTYKCWLGCPVCSALVGVCLVCSALEGACHVCSALVGACHVCSDLVGACHVCSALVGFCLVCSALEGACHVCSALVGVCLVCSALVGVCLVCSHSHLSSTLTCTHCEVLFPPGYISERFSQFVFPCTTWTVDLLS